MAANPSDGGPSRFVIRRVVVALDAQSDHVAAIETACEFAGRWRCAISGVFVVGSDLDRLGGLPGVRQVCLASGGALPGADLEQEIAALERRARRMLAERARRLGMEVAFAVARGGVDAAAGLTDDDLLVVEATARPFGGAAATEARWLRLAETATQPVLLRRRRSATPGPVASLYDGTAASERALAAAARLADDRGQSLVLVLAGDLDEGAEAALAPALEGRRPPARILRAGPGEGGWARTLAAQRAALVVIPAGMPPGRWLGSVDTDVLILRR